jgi:hypothetical protein
MKICALLFLMGISLFFQGCKYPEPPVVTQNDPRPLIGVSGAPEGSFLFVDGSEMGLTRRFNGKNGVLLVETGKHKIEVKSAKGEVLFSKEVFLGASTIKVFSMGKK